MAFVAAAAPFLALAGAGIQAGSTIAGGIASQNAANYQAEVARNNKTIAEQNAVRAEQAGMVQAEAQGRKNAARLGAVKVAQAASNIDVNRGSAVDVQAGERETGLLDSETILQNADLKAYGYRVQGQNFEAESRLEQAKADRAVPAAALSATGSILSNASSLGFKYGGSTTWSGGGGGGDAVYAPDEI